MLIRSGAVLGTAVAAVVLGAPHAMAAPSYQAHWTLDEIGSSTAADVTGNGHDGVNYDVVGDGSGYVFNGTSSRVVVRHEPGLNSGPADFSWGVTLSMTTARMIRKATQNQIRTPVTAPSRDKLSLSRCGSGPKFGPTRASKRSVTTAILRQAVLFSFVASPRQTVLFPLFIVFIFFLPL